MFFRRSCLLLAGSLVLFGSQVVRAAEGPVFASGFEECRYEMQLGVGMLVSENFQNELRPQLHDVDATVRFGRMLSRPFGEGIWRGNFEALLDLDAGGVIKGPGTTIIGTTVVLRRNMILRGARLVPYYQVGFGGAYSDAHEERPQRILGSAFLFNLQAGFGARYFYNEKHAVFLEFDYRHLSNGGLAERNAGLNSAAAFIGLSCYF